MIRSIIVRVAFCKLTWYPQYRVCTVDRLILDRLEYVNTVLASDASTTDVETVPRRDESIADETCPACQSPVPFEHLRTASCSNGHIWGTLARFVLSLTLIFIFFLDRCSITLGLIRSTALRTCITCSRKALVGRAPADTEAEDANGMEVDGSPATTDDLLRGLPKCVWCGGLFVTLR